MKALLLRSYTTLSLQHIAESPSDVVNEARERNEGSIRKDAESASFKYLPALTTHTVRVEGASTGDYVVVFTEGYAVNPRDFTQEES